MSVKCAVKKDQLPVQSQKGNSNPNPPSARPHLCKFLEHLELAAPPELQKELLTLHKQPVATHNGVPQLHFRPRPPIATSGALDTTNLRITIPPRLNNDTTPLDPHHHHHHNHRPAIPMLLLLLLLLPKNNTKNHIAPPSQHPDPTPLSLSFLPTATTTTPTKRR